MTSAPDHACAFTHVMSGMDALKRPKGEARMEVMTQVDDGEERVRF